MVIENSNNNDKGTSLFPFRISLCCSMSATLHCRAVMVRSLVQYLDGIRDRISESNFRLFLGVTYPRDFLPCWDSAMLVEVVLSLSGLPALLE